MPNRYYPKERKVENELCSCGSHAWVKSVSPGYLKCSRLRCKAIKKEQQNVPNTTTEPQTNH